MPGSIPFERPESTYGGASIGISDDPAYPEMERSLHARSYWFGGRLLQCWVAEAVFQNADSSSDGTDIDAELMRALKSFPYEMCLKKITEHPLIHIPVDVSRINGDDYAKLMTVIGHTIYDGEKEVKKELAAIVQGCTSLVNEPMVDHWATELPQRPPSPPDSLDTQLRGAPKSMDPGTPLYLYRQKVEEWQKQSRVELEWQERPINVYNDWECKLTVKGPSVGKKEFTIVAKQKKEARFKAAKEACEFFDL